MPFRVPPFIVTGSLALGGGVGTFKVLEHLERDQKPTQARNMQTAVQIGAGIGTVAGIFNGINQSLGGKSSLPAYTAAALLAGGMVGAGAASVTGPPGPGQYTSDGTLFHY